jgi:hypothetical protein
MAVGAVGRDPEGGNSVGRRRRRRCGWWKLADVLVWYVNWRDDLRVASFDKMDAGNRVEQRADRKEPDMAAQPNIVLVHGAWADGSSWSAVIEHLQADGSASPHPSSR